MFIGAYFATLIFDFLGALGLAGVLAGALTGALAAAFGLAVRAAGFGLVAVFSATTGAATDASVPAGTNGIGVVGAGSGAL
jgi:hypothetical protein